MKDIKLKKKKKRIEKIILIVQKRFFTFVLQKANINRRLPLKNV